MANDTIGKNDQSMNDEQDNLVHDEMLFLSLESCMFSHLLSSLRVYSPHLNSSNFDAILNCVIFPRW